MIDISLLRVLSTRESFDKLYASIPKRSLEKRTQVLVADINRYYQHFDKHTEIDFVQFRDMFRMWHPGLDEEQVSFYDKILTHAEKELDTISHAVIVNAMLEMHMATEIAEVLEQYNAGEDIDILAAIGQSYESTLAARERRDEDNWIKPDFDSIADTEIEPGLEWRLAELQEANRPMLAGDFIIVAARPGAGKTSFLTCEITHMASQLDDRPVLYLNNESKGQRIIKRCIQSALGVTIPELAELSREGTLAPKYANAVGDYERIRVIDIHDMWNWQVAEIIEQHKPKLVVFDMIDNIKFAGMSLSGGARTDQMLEEMYKYFRTHAGKFDYTGIATSQVSADGEGMQFPTKDMLKDSKTGKQGACDQLIILGQSDDPMMKHSRFVSTPKNKLGLDANDDYLRAEVIFDASRGRYKSPEVR